MLRRVFLRSVGLAGLAPVFAGSSALSRSTSAPQTRSHELITNFLAIRTLRVRWASQWLEHGFAEAPNWINGEQELFWSPSAYRVTYHREGFAVEERCRDGMYRKSMTSIVSAESRVESEGPVPAYKVPYVLLDPFLPTLHPFRNAVRLEDPDLDVLKQGRWTLSVDRDAPRVRRAMVRPRPTAARQRSIVREYDGHSILDAVHFPAVVKESRYVDQSLRLSLLWSVLDLEVNQPIPDSVWS